MLDLTNALPGQPDACADFLQRHRIFAFQPISQLENLRGALVDFIEEFRQMAKLVAVVYLLVGTGLCVSATRSLMVNSPSLSALLPPTCVGE